VIRKAGGGAASRRRHLTILAIGTLAIAAILLWRLVPADRERGVDGTLVTLAAQPVPADARARLDIPPGAAAPLPASLIGTAVDGGFTVDAGGHFVPDREALRLFEYFFSANGEEASDILRGRILLHAFASGYKEMTVREIAAVLDRYIAYREAARAALGSGDGRSGDLASRVGELRALQRTMLGADLQRTFYGEEDQLANLDMERLAILQDRIMTRGEKQQALAALEARLPAPTRDARHAASAPSALHQRVEALKASGGSIDAIGALRRAEVGEPAAARLAALDRERDRWNARLEAYRTEESTLRASFGGNAGESYRQALESLRRRHFSGTELVRVRALDAEPR